MNEIQLLLETKSPTKNARTRATLAAELLEMDAQEAIDLSSWATAAEFVEHELAMARLARDTMQVRFTSSYDDGQEFTEVRTLPQPTAITDEWWESEVFPHTGTGRTHGEAIYTAHVIDGPFAGYIKEWG